MVKIDITFLEAEKWEEIYLREKLNEVKNISLSFFAKPLSDAILKKIAKTNILATFIYSRVDRDILSKLPGLRYVATMSTGFDHIDLKECTKLKIKVSNVPYYGENTVAEHTMALMLALSRKIPESIERVRKYNFELLGLKGFDLKDKVLGIVGLGHIGQHVARMAKGFEMKVLAFDPKRDNKLAKKLGIKYVDLNYLLANSDIISLHAPYNKKTHHLINGRNIKLMSINIYKDKCGLSSSNIIS